ncbi:hypothetical protein PMKS-000265 [Pichia membranifaciens]|uniref:Uncharacterized protein n=1 Tax=Pichia membranifaciens TaxID=4926 RepID=A0A1Q2YBA1_9ASCO|nr:hypothetical protein PMKS-000265 [Pichia membranifaciens]
MAGLDQELRKPNPHLEPLLVVVRRVLGEAHVVLHLGALPGVQGALEDDQRVERVGKVHAALGCLRVTNLEAVKKGDPVLVRLEGLVCAAAEVLELHDRVEKAWTLGRSEGEDGEHVLLVAGQHVEDDDRLGVVLAVLVEHTWAFRAKGTLAELDVDGNAQDGRKPK